MNRGELQDELAFLLNSLEDLERERAAGDLTPEDYESLRDRDTRRAAEVLRALEDDATTAVEGTGAGSDVTADRGDGPGAAGIPLDRSHRRRRRGVLVGALLVLLAAVAVTVVVAQTGARLPGQTETGSVSLSKGAEQRRTLAQAETLESSGNAAGALRLYLQILAGDPTQPEALAEAGWLEFEAGVKSKDATLLSDAQQREQAAQRADPGAYAPHLYLGSMYLAERDADAAVAQYRQFLADGPPQAEVQTARGFIEDAFRLAGVPVPAGLGTTGTSSAG